MFSLRSNALPGAPPPDPPPTSDRVVFVIFLDKTIPKMAKGGRPRGDPNALRTATIGVRVCAGEYAQLREKADQMGMTPAQWLRAAALARRLPSPPVPAINREQYAELARLAANLNQLARAANEGKRVVVAPAFLEKLTVEVKQLRLALLGVESTGD